MLEKFEDLQGCILSSVEKNNDELIFTLQNGEQYKLYHSQYCCEDVYIEDINGNLDDLTGSPILMAEEINNADRKPISDYEESYTWTFYKLATVKGYVTIRWYGSSNGYYSEEVDFVRC